MRHFLLIVVPSLLLASARMPAQKSAETSSGPMLHRYNLSAPPQARFKLPAHLGEASGLAMTADGRLFVHNDERGAVYQLDYTNGRIIKRFSLGKVGVRGDFEGIAVKRSMFYLIESNGTVYEFPEGADGDRVEFRTYHTGLSIGNDVEGLCYDPETDCLLLACKGSAGKGLQGVKAVYAYSLASKRLNPTPRFLIRLEEVAQNPRNHEFGPSGIERHPISGTFFVIASRGATIVELTPAGRILAQHALGRKHNPQPEGITFAPDGSLILCNDGQGGPGFLSVYVMR